MSQLVSQARDTLPAIISPPTLSPNLRHAVQDWLREPHPDAGRHDGPTLSPQQREEAERALRELGQCFQSVDLRVALTWLKRLASAVRGAPDVEQMQAKAQAILDVCHDIPGAAWTSASCIEACRIFDWWPSGAQLYAFLGDWSRPMREMREGLRRALEGRREAPQRQGPTPEEREAVSALMAAWRAERAATASEAAVRETVKPRLLSDGQLLEEYRRMALDGNRAAATRYEMLSRKFQRPA